MATSRLVPTVGPNLDATVAVPGSKSIANRAMVCAALADGTTHLSNVPDGDDTVAMRSCVAELGVAIDGSAPDLAITGRRPPWSNPVGTFGPVRLDAGLAGTTSRFVTALAALGDRPTVIDGEPPLRRRPFGPLHDALAQAGVTVATDGASGTLPATVTGPPRSGRVSIAGDVSSQYITALMLVGPYLPGGLELVLTTPLVSRPYVELTASIMALFGAEGIVVGDARVGVEPCTYRAARLAIEPDASSASYPLAIAAVNGGAVTVTGLTTRSLQGDARIVDLLAAMGCNVDATDDASTVHGTAELSGIDVDMAEISDLVPTVATVALFATSPTRIRGVGFIRSKESDRLGDLAHELRKAGATIEVLDDGLAIEPSSDRLHAGRLATHHDHRLAMAFAVLGSRVPGIEVDDPHVVSKSWPDFWTMLDGLAR